MSEGSEHCADSAGAAPQFRYAVIIVHYKTPGMLLECLGTLAQEVDGARDRVIVVDNASGEEAVGPLRVGVAMAGHELLESAENVGFAGANNVGIRHVEAAGGAAYYILLNPDTLVRAGAFGMLRAFLEGHPEAACAGPRLEGLDGAAQLSAFGDPTPISELVRGANIGVLSRLLRRWEVYGAIREEPHRAEWLAGACVMLRREFVEKVGLLDDGFFMYFEEVDYFRRGRKLGMAAWYVPAARVVHLVGQSSGVTTDWSAKRLPAYWFESRHRYFQKHFGYFGMCLADLAWFAGHLMMRVRKLFTGVSHSAVAKREPRDLLSHSVRALLKRRRRAAI